MAIDVEARMDVSDPLSCLARADRAEERDDARGARWWRGLGEALLANPAAQLAFAECRSLRDMMRHRQTTRTGRRGRERAGRFRAMLMGQRILTDGYFLARPTDAERSRLLDGTSLRAPEERPFDTAGLLAQAAAPGAELFPESESAPPLDGRDYRWRGTIRLSAAPGERYRLAAAYVGALVRRYPAARWFAPADGAEPVVVRMGDIVVALVMPIHEE